MKSLKALTLTAILLAGGQIGCSKSLSPSSPQTAPTPVPTATPNCIQVPGLIRLLVVAPDAKGTAAAALADHARIYGYFCDVALAATTKDDPAYDGAGMTPSHYDVVLIWTSGQNFTDPALGSALNAYVAAGGNLVLGGPAFANAIPGFDHAANSPWTMGTPSTAAGELSNFGGQHPIMTAVTYFSTTPSNISEGMALSPDSYEAAAYTDGTPLIAVRTLGAGRVVGLNFHPGQDINLGGEKVLLNSVVFAAHKL